MNAPSRITNGNARKTLSAGKWPWGKDNPERQVSELLFQPAYSVHPYRVPVIGYEDIFKTITRADLLAFFRRITCPTI